LENEGEYYLRLMDLPTSNRKEKFGMLGFNPEALEMEPDKDNS